MKLRPIHDRVVIQLEPQETVTKTGIFLPEVARDNALKPVGGCRWGIVRAVGPGRTTVKGVVVPCAVAVGDRVALVPYADLRARTKHSEADGMVSVPEDHLLGHMPCDPPRGGFGVPPYGENTTFADVQRAIDSSIAGPLHAQRITNIPPPDAIDAAIAMIENLEPSAKAMIAERRAHNTTLLASQEQRGWHIAFGPVHRDHLRKDSDPTITSFRYQAQEPGRADSIAAPHEWGDSAVKIFRVNGLPVDLPANFHPGDLLEVEISSPPEVREIRASIVGTISK